MTDIIRESNLLKVIKKSGKISAEKLEERKYFITDGAVCVFINLDRQPKVCEFLIGKRIILSDFSVNPEYYKNLRKVIAAPHKDCLEIAYITPIHIQDGENCFVSVISGESVCFYNKVYLDIFKKVKVYCERGGGIKKLWVPDQGFEKMSCLLPCKIADYNIDTLKEICQKI